MAYLISVLAVTASGVVLLLLLLRLAAPVRRLAGTVQLSRTWFADRTGLLVARIATLRAELDRRRRHRNSDSSAPTPAA
ncbi:MAG: hypothetical protein M3186_01765 [Actinomycetota bacterium]|nr:hypothetical protein [Actinomycetota bacterium]